MAAVEGRIKALSHAHMLLSQSRWEGADLGRLVTEELEPYSAGDVVSMSGPPTILDPLQAQTLALALHELATNAAKYGALSASSGKIRLAWRHDEKSLIFEWLELGGPKVQQPEIWGYGTKVIRVSLERLGGGAFFDWRPAGLYCRLSLAHDSDLKLPEGRRNSKESGTSHRLQFMPGKASKNVLLVEDESMISMMVEEILTELGLRVVGPYGTISEALRAAKEIPLDAAILDINIGGEAAYPVVDLLVEKEVPVAFISGYEAESVDARYAHIPLMKKPIDRRRLFELFSLYGGAREDPVAAARGHAKAARL
jgi:CheY-like chemotaxis protein